MQVKQSTRLFPVRHFSTLTSIIVTVFTCAMAGDDDSRGTVKSLSPHIAKNPAADTLVVVARIIELPGAFPPNDLYNYVYVMNYRIVKILRGACPEKEILVGQYNPLIARRMVKDRMDPFVDGSVATFTAGDQHRLTLVSPLESIWKDAVEDEYFDLPGQRYFAVKSDLTQ